MARTLLLASLAIALAVPAGAQAERHRIVVTTVGPVCQYRIATQANQTLFHVSPGDQLRLQGFAGTKARFDFVPDNGIAPLAGGSQQVELQGNEATVTVRPRRGVATEHEVVILCCMERQGNVCSDWDRATAASGELGARPAPLPGPAASGPSADDPAPAEPLLGPRMQVQE